MRDRVKILSIALAILAAGSLPSSAQEAIEYVGGGQAAANQVLVKFRSVAPLGLAKLQRTYDLDLAHGVGGTGVYLLRSRSRSAQALLQSLAVRRDVQYAEPDYILTASELPDDAMFGNQWALQNVGQEILGSSGTPGADIGATNAWALSTGGTGHAVAVVDTGVDYGHSDLAANVWSAPSAYSVRLGNRVISCPAGSHGYDAIKNTCDPLDDNGHGTHLAGIIGAVGNNGEGISGVNWSAQILASKFLNAKGVGTTSNAINAIEFAIQLKSAGLANVTVMSNSWGGTVYSKALAEAVNRAFQNEILFVAAAGNTGSNNDTAPFYPASYPAPNVLSVTATDHHDAVMSGANIGPGSVHLGAPGAFILSTVPTSLVPSGYDYMSGTSMAAAYVSGAATLMLAACPDLNTMDARSVLLNTAQPTTALSSTTIAGGRLNADQAIQSCTAPAFSITVLPSSATASQGESANYDVQIVSTHGFGGLISLDVQNAPAGVSFSFGSPIVEPPAEEGLAVTTGLTLTASGDTAPGTYLLTVVGSSDDVVRSAPVWLTVTRGSKKQLNPRSSLSQY
jgi:hypothetical protein